MQPFGQNFKKFFALETHLFYKVTRTRLIDPCHNLVEIGFRTEIFLHFYGEIDSFSPVCVSLLFNDLLFCLTDHISATDG